MFAFENIFILGSGLDTAKHFVYFSQFLYFKKKCHNI